MFNIGIIGCGKIAQVRHIPEYDAHPQARLAGYFDINGPRADGLAEKYGGKVYESWEELVADPKLDAVSVLAANADHAKITIAALRAGKHVLCEKPMAVTLEECQAMADTARETGKFLMIGHNQRLAKAHAKARALIEQGMIGKILTFRTTFGHCGPEAWSIDGANSWFFDKKIASFGALGDLGIHKTDLIQFLTGQRVSEVSGFVDTLDKRDSAGNLVSVDDNAIFIYRMNGGAVGTMTASWTNYGSEDNSTIIYGTDGVMKLYYNPAFSIEIETRNGEKILFDIDKIQTNTNQTKSGVIDLFMNSLINSTPPEISGDDALSAMKAVFAGIESAKTGRTVKII